MRQRQDDGVSVSKVNRYEVRMVAKTVKYLLLQGYEPDQVGDERSRRLRSLVVAVLLIFSSQKTTFGSLCSDVVVFVVVAE